MIVQFAADFIEITPSQATGPLSTPDAFCVDVASYCAGFSGRLSSVWVEHQAWAAFLAALRAFGPDHPQPAKVASTGRQALRLTVGQLDRLGGRFVQCQLKHERQHGEVPLFTSLTCTIPVQASQTMLLVTEFERLAPAV
jgi:hypothetical protein